MILRRIHLHPFAGALDREVAFEPGLNVLLGPNEAGKSTLRRALRQALFVPTKLGKRQTEEEVAPFLPLGGGDTVQVSLDFEADGGLWRLAKRWGGSGGSTELRRPDGAMLSDGPAVQEELGRLLGSTRGTWENVLIAGQGELGNSLDRLDSGGGLRELNERLRRRVFETDGVSLEKLEERLRERWDESFSRWDRALKRPEGGRGVDNPWARGAGRVVSAWYERERARTALEAAESYYRRLDELNAAISAAEQSNRNLADWVAEHEEIYRDAEKRAFLEAELAKVEASGKGLKELSQEWPVAVSQRSEREEHAAKRRAAARELAAELAHARAWEAAGKARAQLAEAEKLLDSIRTAQEQRDTIGKAEPSQIEALERIERERGRIRARLEAAVLRVRFLTERPMRLERRSGVGEMEADDLAADGRLDFVAGGSVTLRDASAGWEVEVSSGEIDLEEEAGCDRELLAEQEAILRVLAVEDLAAARAKLRARDEKSGELAMLERRLRETLGTRSLEDLRAELTGSGAAPDPPRRAAETVAEERARAESEAEAAEREAGKLRQRIDGWTKEHGSSDALLDRLADLRGDHRELRQQIETLRPLPDDGGDLAGFLQRYRARQRDLEARRGDVHRLEMERAAIAGGAPEFEPSEAAERLGLAEAAIDRALREGEAVDRILRAFESLSAELDSGTLAPWQQHLSELLASLTADRYRAFSSALDAASDEGGRAIPFAVLSEGARASLGLAVRLSMARWFLEGRGGFLMLDDPLVDLDPERQQAAAALLRRFAEDRQVIVLTCHPAHAGTLGGARIDL